MFQSLPKSVRIVEVGPRDGLQNESKILGTQEKTEFIRDLHLAGAKAIEVTSFVRKDKIPQMADAEAVCRGIDFEGDIRCVVAT